VRREKREEREGKENECDFLWGQRVGGWVAMIIINQRAE